MHESRDNVVTVTAADKSTALVQPVVRLKAQSLGADGEDWLAALPQVVAELEARWSVRVEESLAGGTAAYVARARADDGGSVIMKICVPDPNFGDEIGTLARARGRGYVQLFASDLGQHAMLLEDLGRPMSRTELLPDMQIATLCQLLAQAWQVPKAASERFAIPHDKATALKKAVNRLWIGLDQPCSQDVLAQTRRFADRRAAAFNGDRCVVVHGDAAPMNALQVMSAREGAETGFVFVDPDGFVGDPEYDLGVALRDWCEELLSSDDPTGLARHYCQLLATGSGLDEQAIWEWGYLERVSTGLYCLAIGANELGQPFLDTAELLL